MICSMFLFYVSDVSETTKVVMFKTEQRAAQFLREMFNTSKLNPLNELAVCNLEESCELQPGQWMLLSGEMTPVYVQEHIFISIGDVVFE